MCDFLIRNLVTEKLSNVSGLDIIFVLFILSLRSCLLCFTVLAIWAWAHFRSFGRKTEIDGRRCRVRGLHLLVASLLCFYSEGDSSELLGVRLRFTETYWDIICFSFLLLSCFCFVSLFVDCRLISLNVLNLLDILLDINHSRLDFFHFFSIKDGWFNHFRKGNISRHYAIWGCHREGLQLGFEHLLSSQKVCQGFIVLLKLHLATTHLENCWR